MRPPDPLPLVVIGHAALLAAVDLHIGGVQVDRDRPAGQRRRPFRGRQVQHPPGHRRQAMLDRLPLGRGDPPGQPGRGGGRQARYRREQLARHVGALPVQPGQEILPGQLRRRDPRQQLPSAKTAIPLLDGADRGIHRFDHAEPAAQLGDRGQARIRRQRPIRRAGPHLLTPPATRTYPAHQIGVLSTGPIITGSDHHPKPERHLSASTGSCHRPTRGIGSDRSQGSEWPARRLIHAGRLLCWRLCSGEAFGPPLDGEEHFALHHPRAWFDDRVRELVLYRQDGSVEAVPADEPGVPVGWPQLE